MRIKIPLEAAIPIAIVILVLWGLLGVGALGRWLEEKLSPQAQKALALGIAAAATLGGLWLFSTFYFITNNRHPVYPGLYLFDLGDVIVASVLVAVGAAAFAWGRLAVVGVLMSFGSAAALFLKPILYPLMSEITWGSDKGKMRPFGLTSETHLYFLLSAAGLLVVGIFMLGKLRQKPAPGQAAVLAKSNIPGVGGAQVSGAGIVPRSREHLIAAPDYPFERINNDMRKLDMHPVGVPAMGGQSAEPVAAQWTDGQLTVSYRYLPEYGLRLLDVSGPSAQYLKNDILNLVYMPTVEGYKVSEMLRSGDPQAQKAGILAAEHIGINGNEKYYIQPLSDIVASGGANAGEAGRVREVLAGRQSLGAGYR